MKKILYGASVQGIQSFIFKTNKLREIAGASQIVDALFEEEFDTFQRGINLTISEDDIIMRAAGSIKLRLDEDNAKKIFKYFPKFVASKYPGLELSQAIVVFEDEDLTNDTLDELESKLRIKRNMPEMPVESGFMALKRDRRTGGVAYPHNKGSNEQKYIDKASWEKEDAIENKSDKLTEKFSQNNIARFPKDFSDLTAGKESGWMAVVHADGNSLGNKMQNLFKKNTGDASEQLKEFSKKLNKATETAANNAFDEVVLNAYMAEKKNNTKIEHYPFRPIILGGDDLTVVIRADLAWEFTRIFLEQFEDETEKTFGNFNGINSKLTACAGIAYIKEKYPFHYGVNLAEELAKRAKKASKAVSKDNPPSSVQFYKVQSSFTEELKDMQERTHLIKSVGIDFNAGPYFIHESEKNEGYYSVEDLNNIIKKLGKNTNEKDKPVSKLRSLISELYENKSTAKFMLNRMESINKTFYKDLNLSNLSKQLKLDKENNINKSIIMDALHLHGFKA